MADTKALAEPLYRIALRSHKNNPSPSLLDEELPPSTRTPITRAPWARRLHDKQEPAINF